MTTVLGIDERSLVEHLAAVTDVDAIDDVAERFARVAWSGIAEPGDGIAGALVEAVGASAALQAVIDGAHAASVAAMIGGGFVSADSGTDAATPIAAVRAALDRWRPRVDSRAPLRSLAQAARVGAGLVLPVDLRWPSAVDDLGVFAPLALWTRGRAEALEEAADSVAIVGARASTGYGEHLALELASGLADRGYAIVSGAAYGIDGVAHRGALASAGTTVAVLAGGVDRLYPSGHDELLRRITDTGLVLSEVPVGTAPTKWRFLQRNRIIAALSSATIVVEAGRRSGSLNTAGHASALGRPLGAVPGPVTSAASAGCHRLLREFDAICVTSADEVAELAPIERRPPLVEPDAGDGQAGAQPSSRRLRVLDAMSSRPRSIERIAAESGLAAADVRAELGMLELLGQVAGDPAGWRRVRTP